MFLQHLRFLAQKSAKAAEQLREKIGKALQSLKKMPERNPWISIFGIPEKKYRKMLVEKRYLLAYQIKNKTVYVDAILDCRMEYFWLVD